MNWLRKCVKEALNERPSKPNSIKPNEGGGSLGPPKKTDAGSPIPPICNYHHHVIFIITWQHLNHERVHLIKKVSFIFHLTTIALLNPYLDGRSVLSVNTSTKLLSQSFGFSRVNFKKDNWICKKMFAIQLVWMKITKWIIYFLKYMWVHMMNRNTYAE